MKTRDLDTLLENEYPYEPPIQLIEMSHHNTNPIFTHEAERFNGWAAMLGFVAAVGAYITTGQIIPAYSKPRQVPPYKWKMSCFDFIQARHKVLLDADLPMAEKYKVIQFFLSKVEEECDNIHSS